MPTKDGFANSIERRLAGLLPRQKQEIKKRSFKATRYKYNKLDAYERQIRMILEAAVEKLTTVADAQIQINQHVNRYFIKK